MEEPRNQAETLDCTLKKPGKYSLVCVLKITVLIWKGQYRKDGKGGDNFQGHCHNPEPASGER